MRQEKIKENKMNELLRLEKIDGGYNVLTKNGKKVGVFEVGHDGYYYYWSDLKGYFNSSFCREIADKLDKVNEKWDKEITEYFEQEQKEKNNG